ncbi:MAG: hypothetical protein AAB726_01990 [Patescibacteria group bacterium]
MNLIIIAVSFVAIALMLLLKIWEARAGREAFITRFFASGDSHVFSSIRLARHLGYFLKEHAIFMVLVRIPSRIEKFFARLKRRSLTKYNSLSGKMRGERVFSSRSSASPFIRTLAGRHGDRR